MYVVGPAICIAEFPISSSAFKPAAGATPDIESCGPNIDINLIGNDYSELYIQSNAPSEIQNCIWTIADGYSGYVPSAGQGVESTNDPLSAISYGLSGADFTDMINSFITEERKESATTIKLDVTTSLGIATQTIITNPSSVITLHI
jgi:hypothetical protein